LIDTLPLLTLRASQAKTIAGGRPSINLILGRLSTAVLMGGTLQ
jgi:mannose/fructose/N-acetylgalactosamine-specific phosphotransferase system component IIC